MTAPITLPLTGGCQCGAHRYVIHGVPLTLYACHCGDCQAQSASAFGMSLSVPLNGLDVRWEQLKCWSRSAASGQSVSCHFCPDCGTRLFHRPSRRAAVVNVKAGSLDDTSWLRPVGHLWTDRAQPWTTFPADALRYPRQPDSYQELYRLWEEQVPTLFGPAP